MKYVRKNVVAMGLMAALAFLPNISNAANAQEIARNYADTLIRIAKSRPNVRASRSMDFQDFCDMLTDSRLVNSDWFQSQLGASFLDKWESLGFIAAWTLEKMDWMAGLRENINSLGVYEFQSTLVPAAGGQRVTRITMKLYPTSPNTVHLYVDSAGHIYNLGRQNGTVLENAPRDLRNVASNKSAEINYVTNLLSGSPHAADYQGSCPEPLR